MLTLVFSWPTVAARSEERFSRNAETDIVCRLLLEKKTNSKQKDTTSARLDIPAAPPRPPAPPRSAPPVSPIPTLPAALHAPLPPHLSPAPAPPRPPLPPAFRALCPGLFGPG